MKKIFIDCGANNGCSIDLFLQKYPKSNEFEIHSFEPNPKLITVLSKYEGKSIIHKKAVFTENTTIDFYLGMDLSSSIRKDKRTGINYKNTPIKVDAIDLSEFIKNNFDMQDYIVLKLDIEGAEYDVLPHLLQEDIFDGWVDELFGEWHLNKLSNITKKQHDDIVQQLNSKGFRMKEWCAETKTIEL
jgi:FkbM family methyltransferase